MTTRSDLSINSWNSPHIRMANQKNFSRNSFSFKCLQVLIDETEKFFRLAPLLTHLERDACSGSSSCLPNT